MAIKCLCGGDALPLIQAGRHTSFVFQNQISRLYVCDQCTHVFFFPTPTEKRLADYYSGTWAEGTNYSIDFCYAAWIDNLRMEVHKPKATFVDAIERLRKEYFKEASRVAVHDAGCGYGALVLKLNMLGFDATGSDVDGQSIELARMRGNNRVYHGHFTEIPDLVSGGVDMLVCYHSLEHYPDPLEFFQIVKRALRPGGLFIMSLPNGAYLPARVDYFGKFDWCFYPGHLQYFTPRSAEILLAKAGLRFIEASSYEWDGTQEDWLLDTASRLPMFRSISRERLLARLAAETFTRDLRVVAVNDEDRSQRAWRGAIFGFFRHRAKTKVMQFPPLGNAVALISDAACNELIDEGVSVLNYRIWRRNGEYFLSLRVLTDHALSNDYIMVLHMADVDDASEAFVNLDFAPCPPTTDWSPMEAVTVVRQLVCPAVIEFRPEKAVNCVRRSALPAGRYAIWVGLWDLEKGLSGRLARLGLVVLPNSLGTTQN